MQTGWWMSGTWKYFYFSSNASRHALSMLASKWPWREEGEIFERFGSLRSAASSQCFMITLLPPWLQCFPFSNTKSMVIIPPTDSPVSQSRQAVKIEFRPQSEPFTLELASSSLLLPSPRAPGRLVAMISYLTSVELAARIDLGANRRKIHTFFFLKFLSTL